MVSANPQAVHVPRPFAITLILALLASPLIATDAAAPGTADCPDPGLGPQSETMAADRPESGAPTPVAGVDCRAPQSAVPLAAAADRAPPSVPPPDPAATEPIGQTEAGDAPGNPGPSGPDPQPALGGEPQTPAASAQPPSSNAATDPQPPVARPDDALPAAATPSPPAPPARPAAVADPIPPRPNEVSATALPPPSLPPESARLDLPIVLDPVRPPLPGGPAVVLPPADRPQAASAPVDTDPVPLVSPQVRDDEARLHAGLAWDQCGPRVGGASATRVRTPTAASQVPVDTAADQANYEQSSDLVHLRGGVTMVQGDQRLEADRSTYNRRSGEAQAEGNVFLEYAGGRLTADSANYNLNTKEGHLQDVRYRLSGDSNLRGSAATADLLPGQITRYRDVTYTTCPPGRGDWSIRARDLKLDHPDGMGTARDAQLRFWKLPVFYTPYLSFPIDDRRRSGLLIPTVGSSNATGMEIILPYYWNIAPNMDATFYPRLMSSRGLMLGAEFRHLASFQKAELNAEVLPHDAEDPEAGTRGALRLEQTGHFGARWGTTIDYSVVSDDQYLADFGNRLDVTSVRNLVQRGDLTYSGGWYSLHGWAQGFQTVDPDILPVDRPYAQLPHLEFDVPATRWGLAEYAFNGRYDYFDNAAKVHGSRGVLLPSVRLPIRRSYGHLIPRLRLYGIGYNLSDVTAGQPAQQSYVIPSLDLDTGLVFDRDITWFGQGALQTLEPRLYYVLTSYEDQANAPLFDTTELDFSYASLFRPNRFTGYDRISDDNRLTVGLTSRTISDRSGREWLRASLGQIYYFNPRRVQLTDATYDETTTSSVAGELATSPAPGWSARASFQWDPNLSADQWEKRVLQLRYAPGADRVFNLAYRYNIGQTEPERYENTDLSFRLPLTPRVGLVGRWLYSLLDAETVDAFAGIEFGRCCWRMRILGRHLKTSADSAGTTSVLFQLELAGLGSLGNKIDKLLEQGIYGYNSD